MAVAPIGALPLAAEPASSAHAVRAAEAGDSGALFAAQCSACHDLEAPDGDLLALEAATGPGLHDAGNRLRPEWVESWLIDPRPIRPRGFMPHRYTVATVDGDRVETARIPQHPRLEADAARSLAAFLASQKRPIVPYPPAEPNPSIRAQVHFSKILPCGGCHRLGGDGGVSAPDLSTAAERLQPEWVRSFTWDPQAWGHPLMPRTRLRADQLLALTELMVAPGAATEPATGAETAVAAELLPSPEVGADHGRAVRLYRVLCSQCHGIQANGLGINAPHLFIAPRDHSSYDEMVRLTDQKIFDAISLGGAAVGKSSLMPSWGAVLEDDDIWLLVAYLRELSGTS